jgi:hypothetical protein
MLTMDRFFLGIGLGIGLEIGLGIGLGSRRSFR